MLNETEREHFDRILEAAARAFDPHTEYLPPITKEDFDISMRGSLEGIGASLKEDDSYIKVVSIVPGGPAFLQGQLHAEDIILWRQGPQSVHEDQNGDNQARDRSRYPDIE